VSAPAHVSILAVALNEDQPILVEWVWQLGTRVMHAVLEIRCFDHPRAETERSRASDRRLLDHFCHTHWLDSSQVEVDELAMERRLLCVQLSRMARIRAPACGSLVRGSVPWLRISSRFQPMPTPNSNRLPLRWSTLATSLAAMIGLRSMTRQTPLPIRGRLVASAAEVRATNRS
jgi:hypothetical protein